MKFFSIAGAIGGFVSRQKESRELRKAQKQEQLAREKENRIARIQQRRAQALAFEEGRVESENIRAAGAASGAPGSSGAAGGAFGLQSSIASNIGFGNQVGGLREESLAASNRAADFRSRAGRFGNVGQFFSSLPGIGQSLNNAGVFSRARRFFSQSAGAF